LGLSVNSRIQMDLLEPCQYGHMLCRWSIILRLELVSLQVNVQILSTMHRMCCYLGSIYEYVDLIWWCQSGRVLWHIISCHCHSILTLEWVICHIWEVVQLGCMNDQEWE
jgi:hypothetical protein